MIRQSDRCLDQASVLPHDEVVFRIAGESIGYPVGDVPAQDGVCVWVRKLHDGKERAGSDSSIK